MKKQNKFLLTAALVASLVGGYAVQAEVDTNAQGNALHDLLVKTLAENLSQSQKSKELMVREIELQEMENNYNTKKDSYTAEEKKIAELQMKWKKSVVENLRLKDAEKASTLDLSLIHI